ncbi:MAG: hypothetical protein F2681_02675 [Actinobacteria bacterium]|nr:hypothetical protein [Actinomycetota bacterium]MSW76318.1 hypothetical protein [Actinomycetota bacterium]MSX54583.1 hypothetical protein [Actinomycetota bacterium]MSZ82028.1 hypothetical protein [Actinomycetota bacterium]MTB16867.1 hypothetical protein [Actinomycetota bacterium]
MNDRWLAAAQIAAGVLLAVAATAMPWASRSVADVSGVSVGSTVARGGVAGVVLAVLAAVVVLDALLASRVEWLRLASALTALVALAMALALALGRIARMNSAIMAEGTTRTSYEPGAILGVGAAAAMVVVAVIRSRRALAVRRAATSPTAA